MNPPEITFHDGFAIVRDDLIPGGTKVRVLVDMMRTDPAEEFVFGGPAQGYAQLALAYAAREVGKKATYFVAARRELHPYTLEAQAAGAQIVQVKAGRLNVVQAAARRYVETKSPSGMTVRFYPLGFDVPAFRDGLVKMAREQVRDLRGITRPRQVWTTAGSGAMSRAFQEVWPDAEHHAVRIGFPPDVGGAKLWEAPEEFGERARVLPPFPSCPWYDAKMWQFVRRHASKGALIWNVGA